MPSVASNDNDFENDVLNSPGMIIVDFWAEWCGPCKAIGPALEELSNELPNIKVVKVNIDNNPVTPTKYGVRGIPTLLLFNDGNLVDSKVGALPKSKIEEWVKSH